MVSNDDVGFDVQQRKLAYPDFKLDLNNTAVVEHMFQVPTNKQWIIKAITAERTDSYETKLELREPEAIYVGFLYYDKALTYELFQPIQELILDEGWKVIVKYYYTVTYTCESHILYEQRDKY